MESAATNRPRIGLLGGTFDPVHNGHLAIARASIEAFGLERVILMPSAITPHKRHLRITAVEHRVAMLRLAAGGIPNLEVSTLELERGGVSYTVDTLRLLRAQEPESDIWLLIGMDSLRELHTWHRPREIIALCTVATLERPGSERPFETVPGFDPDTSALLLRNTARGPLVAAASTDIRERIAQNLPIGYLVPASVEGYIKRNGLYRPSAESGNQ